MVVIIVVAFVIYCWRLDLNFHLVLFDLLLVLVEVVLVIRSCHATVCQVSKFMTKAKSFDLIYLFGNCVLLILLLRLIKSTLEQNYESA